MRRVFLCLMLALPLCAFDCGRDFGKEAPFDYAATVGVAAEPGQKLFPELTQKDLRSILNDLEKILTAHGFIPESRSGDTQPENKFKHTFAAGEALYFDDYRYQQSWTFCHITVSAREVRVRFKHTASKPSSKESADESLASARLIRAYLETRFPDLKSRIEFTEEIPTTPSDEKTGAR